MNRKSATPARHVSFYRVSLVCEAAPHLGCGTRAKPVLHAIEAETAVLEAWLNREGTMLAVVWADLPERRSAVEPVLAVLGRHGLSASELEGSERHKALEAFTSGRDWHRPAGLDRLSEEEARVIAVRMVARLRARIALAPDQAERLAIAISDACARILPNASATSPTTRRDEIAAAILDAGHAVLGDVGVAALAEAVALGHRPLPCEA